MRELTLDDGLIEFVGALDMDVSTLGVTPRRLPAWTRPQIPTCSWTSSCRSHRGCDCELQPSTFDLMIHGEIAAQARTSVGIARLSRHHSGAIARDARTRGLADLCPSAEDRPGPTIPGEDGRFITVAGLDKLRSTRLTLRKAREAIARAVALRRELGDHNLHYLDGLRLFGPDDASDVPDDLHPNAEGYVRMGERFATLGFGPGAALA